MKTPTRRETEIIKAAYLSNGGQLTDGFGDLLDDAGLRQFALRAAGWTCWIDEDGYPITDAEVAAIVAQMGETS